MIKLKLGDGIIILLAAFVIGVIVWQFYGVGDEALQLEVRTANERFLYPLGTHRHLVLAGPIGDSHIEMDEHGAYFVTPAPCTDKICIQSGLVAKINEWAACLPNKVMIRVIGREEDAEVDGIAS